MKIGHFPLHNQSQTSIATPLVGSLIVSVNFPASAWADENQMDVSKGVPSGFVSLFDSFLAVFDFLADG